MKKFYLSLVLVFFAVLNVIAVDVSITMNSVSRTMTLAEKGTGTPVDVGSPTTSYLYTFSADAGNYILTGYNAAGIITGTMEISIFEGGDILDGGGQYGKIFKFTTVTAYVTNTGWVLGTDYDINCQAVSREGDIRVITTTTGSVTAGRKTFLMQIGDTYSIDVTTSATQVAAGYLSKFNFSSTVTASSVNAGSSVPKRAVYSLLIPQNASIYVGIKRGGEVQSTGGTHYVAFTEKFVDSVKVEGSKKRYYYTGGQNCWYNFKVSQAGKLTNGGKFQVPAAGGSLEITQADLNAASPLMIDHDASHNSGANVADILMNINGRGHLKMTQGEKFQHMKFRIWQLTDNSTNNYFIEPDYHYRIVDLNGNDITNVITINDKGEISAVGDGTAIVLVTYDAIQLKSWASSGVATNYFFGPLFSAIWPENTGAFVVTVGGGEDTGIVPNMKIQEENRVENTVLGTDVDAEHDVFYYPEDSAGYRYTFKPRGVVSVSIANPILGANSASFNGFKNVPANANGSYTMLLTHGRNIIKLTSAGGTSVYQVISAKPAGYVISNKTRPGQPILPGDDVNVQYHGLFHPANKMAGIYNMSAYVTYNGTPAGNSLILSANQYQFGGTPSAQLSYYHVPTTCTDTFKLRKGALQVLGFGSLFGKHRDISIIGGINPNFTAAVRVQYFGSMPNINIPVTKPTEGFKFTGLPDSTEVFVISADYTAKNSAGANVTLKDTLAANENGEFLGTYRSYSYTIYAPGYKALSGTNTITAGEGIKSIPVTMQLIDDKWDGINMAKPKQVTAAESAVAGSMYENKEGYYKITNAYELRWVAYQTDRKNAAINAILVNDIDLNNKSWSPIGSNNNAGYRYSGIFEGNNKTINGLFVDMGSGIGALFQSVEGATIKNLTVDGVIANGKAALIGLLSGKFLIENCHNKANIINGDQGTGGLIGQITSATGDAIIRNCSNTGSVNVGNNMYGGGFVGQIQTAVFIENCWNTGSVTSTSETGYIGGFSGSMSAAATVKNCYNTGNLSVSGEDNIGGMIGYAASGSIINCYNVGVISNTSANPSGAIKGTGTEASVTNCYVSDNIGSNVNTDAATVVKSKKAFVSGEVTWLLGNAFGQTLGTDTLPLLNKAFVYKVNYTNNMDAVADSFYTNGALPSLTKHGYINVWKTVSEGNVITQVTQDSKLFILYTLQAPTILTGIPSEANIALSWTASTSATGYNIYLNGELLKTITAEKDTIKNLLPGTQYTIEVEAFDAAGNRSAKATTSVTTTDETAPAIPSGLNGAPSETSIALSWIASTDNVGVTGYSVYVDDVLKGTVTGTTYTVTGLTATTSYTLSIEAFDAAGNKSVKVSKAITTTDETAPNTPINLTGTASATTIILSWTAATDNVGVTGYNVYEGDVLIGTVAGTTYTAIGLTANTEYHFSVEAIDAAGNKSTKASAIVSTAKVTGITSVSGNNISVYPNPFDSFIMLEVTTDGNAVIYDLSGKPVLQVYVYAGTNRINTSTLGKGVYMLKFGLNSIKIVK
jgi:chitodextrinase